jgi:hypothetical protein
MRKNANTAERALIAMNTLPEKWLAAFLWEWTAIISQLTNSIFAYFVY